MADVLDLQSEEPEETPNEEKISAFSVLVCQRSQVSYLRCIYF